MAPIKSRVRHVAPETASGRFRCAGEAQPVTVLPRRSSDPVQLHVEQTADGGNNAIRNFSTAPTIAACPSAQQKYC
jgi:hypothetical protein